MSWAEVKKLNSDLSTPLNLAALINHIDLVGSNYVGYGDIGGTVALLATDAVYAHEVAKNTLANLVKDSNTIATAVTNNNTAFKKCLSDPEVWAIVSQNSIITDFCEDKLSASTGVGAWLAFIADIDNATLVSCDTMNAVAESETAMNAILASEPAMNAIIASGTALYSIAVNNDTVLGLSRLASEIEGMATTAWESDAKWGIMKSALDASSLFTKSGLLTDTGGTHNRTGNLITLIESAYAANHTSYKLSITPRYTGCYAHGYVHNWSTGKHIMWGGHSSTHGDSNALACNVKHYMYTPII